MSIEGVYELADGEKGKVSLRIKAEGEDMWRVPSKVANNMNCDTGERCFYPWTCDVHEDDAGDRVRRFGETYF